MSDDKHIVVIIAIVIFLLIAVLVVYGYIVFKADFSEIIDLVKYRGKIPVTDAPSSDTEDQSVDDYQKWNSDFLITGARILPGSSFMLPI